MNNILFKNKYRIKSTRLKNWDYSNDGAYSVTICTKNRKFDLGNIDNGEIKLSTTGKITQKYWQGIPKHYPFVELGEFIIMSNHVTELLQLKTTIVETRLIASLQVALQINITPC